MSLNFCETKFWNLEVTVVTLVDNLLRAWRVNWGHFQPRSQKLSDNEVMSLNFCETTLKSQWFHSSRICYAREESLKVTSNQEVKNFLLKISDNEVMSLNFSKLNFGTLKSLWPLSSIICYAREESIEVTSNQEVKNFLLKISHIEVMSLNFCETTLKSLWSLSSNICYAREESLKVTSNQEVKNFLLKISDNEVMSLNFSKLNFGNFEVTVSNHKTMVSLVDNLLRA